MRSQKEIYEAHDLLDAILRKELRGVHFEAGEMESRGCLARAVLCWILQHDEI